MNEKIREPGADRLFDAILSLESREECYAFFEDLCTIQELKSMASRLEVATMLRDGLTYQEITDRTGVSAATISRVNRALSYGADGYRRVLERQAPESGRSGDR